MKKSTKLIAIGLLVVTLSGCTGRIKDGKDIVKSDTGQPLTSNILCKPESEELLKKYEKYNDKLDVKLEDLPTCSEFTPNKIKYNGLWESLFVKPLAWIILKLGYLVKNMGLSVIIIGLLIRLLMFPLQVKTVKQSEGMKKAQPEIERIERKYRNKTDNESLMMKSQETMMVYKKYEINPVSSCLGSTIQLPLFIAFLEAIERVPKIFEGSFLGMKLGMTPTAGIAQHQYIYLILIVLIILSTYISFKSSMGGNESQPPEMAEQMKFMSIFMIVTISFASLGFPTAIALYWIATNIFALVQNFIIKKIMEKRI